MSYSNKNLSQTLECSDCLSSDYLSDMTDDISSSSSHSTPPTSSEPEDDIDTLSDIDDIDEYIVGFEDDIGNKTADIFAKHVLPHCSQSQLLNDFCNKGVDLQNDIAHFEEIEKEEEEEFENKEVETEEDLAMYFAGEIAVQILTSQILYEESF